MDGPIGNPKCSKCGEKWWLGHECKLVPFSVGLSAAYDLYERPFKYDPNGQMIFDGKGNLVVDVRGWGRIEKMDNGMELHDTVGEIIAEALNEKWSRDPGY